MSKYTLIGAGNAATAIGYALLAAGHECCEVYSRTEANAKLLAERLGCVYTADITQVGQQADIYLIAAKDDAIERIGSELRVGDSIVAHTSGICSKELLENVSPNYGIFYPNVSMTKDTRVDIKEVLILIEGSNEQTVQGLEALASTVSNNVKVVAEKQRQALHIAAVFANNFTNHLYIIAEDILQREGLDFSVLRPLIMQHLSNLQKVSPAILQTGPSTRGDTNAMGQHLKLLKQNTALAQLYTELSKRIEDWKQKQTNYTV